MKTIVKHYGHDKTSNERKFLIYLVDDAGNNLSCHDVTGEDEKEEILDELADIHGTLPNEFVDIMAFYNETNAGIDPIFTERPLILVFYLDRSVVENAQLKMQFQEGLNHYIEQHKVNIMGFVLPTDGEERIECLNPVVTPTDDMDKIVEMLKDMEKKFDVNQMLGELFVGESNEIEDRPGSENNDSINQEDVQKEG
jgi:hypothetical protein